MKKISDYKPLKGFYDLRKYKLSKKLFKQLWKIQIILFEAEKMKDYYKKYLSTQWQKMQELSADYQQILKESQIKALQE